MRNSCRIASAVLIIVGALGSSTQAAMFTISPDLTSVSDGNVSMRVLTIPEKDIAALSQSFGEVESCTIIIEIPVGTKDGNVSHGALCLREYDRVKKNVLVCYDDMVGHSDILFVDKNNATKRNLIQFVMDRCYGG
jgi:hypothetical protein